MKIGIPYARQQQDPASKAWFVKCPICGLRVDLIGKVRP